MAVRAAEAWAAAVRLHGDAGRSRALLIEATTAYAKFLQATGETATSIRSFS